MIAHLTLESDGLVKHMPEIKTQRPREFRFPLCQLLVQVPGTIKIGPCTAGRLRAVEVPKHVPYYLGEGDDGQEVVAGGALGGIVGRHILFVPVNVGIGDARRERHVAVLVMDCGRTTKL